ncbi:response regulator, CheY-like receiver domain protein [Desulforapulum autotrophicum HRM2]|uniref:Response regulator, CheY-like receiver domain protein n=1 Tax=Desulforapulum autotrophicum (strain ATCC 43914 / DSM 3382 / VKM B-1955 / HRM2) TaxID=177437 RepID=C0QG14_DESAH|nr:response regulator transcription factor [Desulforapulum autotrophicum]ACN17593.1 response regulator, CheY-like receiver domain protein [Desulforapulum autotrophicum HRM2]
MNHGETISTKIQILIVDDDKKLCRLVTDYLTPMGYDVASAHDGIKGLEILQSGCFHAVILDVMMPKMDGFEMLKQLRKQSDIPVLMLTAMGEETDRIVGLEMGADDYLPKTFSSRELLARLRAVTRRHRLSMDRTVKSQVKDNTLTAGELEIHLKARTAYLSGKPLNLTPLEYDLLLTLAKFPARVLSRDQLLDAVAGRSYDVFDRSVDVHISSLRRKLGEDPRNPRFIQTVRTVGYMFNDPDAPHP